MLLAGIGMCQSRENSRSINVWISETVLTSPRHCRRKGTRENEIIKADWKNLAGYLLLLKQERVFL